MLKNSRLVLAVAVALASIVLASVGCGGTGAAPINGGSLAGVAVSVHPATMTITTGTTQPFTATVINTSETGVGWLVNGFPGGVIPLNGVRHSEPSTRMGITPRPLSFRLRLPLP